LNIFAARDFRAVLFLEADTSTWSSFIVMDTIRRVVGGTHNNGGEIDRADVAQNVMR
jgi:hypothetical protein